MNKFKCSVLSLLKHIVSFRCFVYMIIDDDAELDIALKFRIDDYDYTVFVKGFSCAQLWDLGCNCPNKTARKRRLQILAQQARRWLLLMVLMKGCCRLCCGSDSYRLPC